MNAPDWALAAAAGQSGEAARLAVTAAIEAADAERRSELLAAQPHIIVPGLEGEFAMRLDLGQMAYHGRYGFAFVPSPGVDLSDGRALVEDLEPRLIEGDREAELSRGIAGFCARLEPVP